MERRHSNECGGLSAHYVIKKIEKANSDEKSIANIGQFRAPGSPSLHPAEVGKSVADMPMSVALMTYFTFSIRKAIECQKGFATEQAPSSPPLVKLLITSRFNNQFGDQSIDLSIIILFSITMRSHSLRRPKKQSTDPTMTGRRHSMTAQISRQARRLSAAIAPQLVKIEPLNTLQNIQRVDIKLSDINQYRRAVDQYVLKNSVQFDPVDFDVIDPDGQHIIRASLYPEGLAVREGKRKVYDLSFIDEDSPNCIAKIKHPVTGMSVYEMQEIGDIITIQSNTDDTLRTRIEISSATWLSLLFACGCAFTRQKWCVVRMDVISAIIAPISSIYQENAVKVEWTVNSENEVRLIAISFGLALMIREGFPSLFQLLKEFRSRRA
ncbi:hypothetical protein KIN20_005908 [Parelaphostrongylus tenuis]|uniref:Uncharacterized protein n=1 Tax=Parelaphostrongylus tenuis TaxID=148309 RepID=A0AAD5MM70_PARTN|nr:hypothetical protein KIN20_005908 [Parelaphostrongylus tenuis]